MTDFLSVRVRKERPEPFDAGIASVPMYRAVIAEQRAFLTGNRFVEVASLAYERSEDEARSKAAAVLRRWAGELDGCVQVEGE